MIIQLFIFSFIFFILGIVFFVRKKKLLGWFFVILGIFALGLGSIVVSLHPETLPF